MDRLASLIAGVILLATAAAQAPSDGELVVSLAAYPSFAAGGLVVVDPQTGAVRPLATETGGFPNWVEMGADNRTLFVATLRLPGGRRSDLSTFDPVTSTSTVHATLTGVSVNAFELDHDGQWILAGGQPTAKLLSFDPASNTVALLFSSTDGIFFNGMAIDRDNSAWPYVLAAFDPNFQLHELLTRILGADRTGKVTDIVQSGETGTGDPLTFVSSVSVDPGSGDYLATKLTFNTPYVNRVSPAGIVTQMPNIRRANGSAFAQDGTAWIIGDDGPSLAVFQIDFAKGKILRTLPLGMRSSDARATSVTIYGSRRVNCTQSGNQVGIVLDSQRAGDENKPYRLYWSLARRPGLVEPSGERLDLHKVNHYQFASGTTDGNGAATVAVNLPASVFAGVPSGVTVFVAGVIEDGGGNVRTVTNTHWFVMP